ncbi:methylated-DNA--[protein]-cysteine S-methyltransferase [Nocardia sp. NBC_00508]|uniref:methylated-DNA--[protein]-cysteine S-methyltransferase n=1 Tax=Nocardia sp. NBC_00508 TaxID=2975992 RepID=UPI002E804E69|nr:methylated-DNA--[protein]-cysteine S-methyltransferase [Nocardia sp. NBC_00508]WUD69126.1 methylated-DNA--[protein]-cysteine S-methyltransferase [Nocardia sp. NBC_00508]
MSDATRHALMARTAAEATGSATKPVASGRPAAALPVAAALFDTAIGCCAIAWSGEGVIRFQLPEASPAATRMRITRSRTGHLDEEIHEDAPTQVIAEAIAGIRTHLAGRLDDLRWIPVDTTGIPAFHRAVYAVTRAIDPGHTLSYGQVAERVGAPGAAQAVGQALGRNPIPLIIPCHRVLAADHALHGFSAPGGLDTKQRLLTIERTPGFGEPTLF